MLRTDVLELVLVLATALGAAGWWARARHRSGRPGNVPIRLREIAVALATGGVCLLANAAAVAALDPVSITNLGPLALAYHERRPSPFLFATALLLLLLSSAVPRPGRAALVLFAGAAAANVASPLLWDGAVPDYLVLERVDVIANLSDVVMVVTATVAGVSLFALGPRHGPPPPAPRARTDDQRTSPQVAQRDDGTTPEQSSRTLDLQVFK